MDSELSTVPDTEIMFSMFIAIIYYVLYKIFVNGINVIKDYNIKKAFTREELVAGAIMVCIACVVFRNIKVFDVNSKDGDIIEKAKYLIALIVGVR